MYCIQSKEIVWLSWKYILRYVTFLALSVKTFPTPELCTVGVAILSNLCYLIYYYIYN